MDAWSLIRAFARDDPQSRSAISRRSFDEFLSHGVPRVLAETPPMTWKSGSRVFVGGPKGTQISFSKPKAAPATCRLLDQTYRASIVADLTDSSGNVVASEVRICDIPLMVGSETCVTSGASMERIRELRECPHDAGGYFIVDGKEKAVASVLATSHTAVTHRVSFANMHATHFVSAFAGACVVSASEKRSGRTPAMTMAVAGRNGRTVRIPIVSAIRAFGPSTDKDIVAAVSAMSCGALNMQTAHDALRPSFEEVAERGPLQTSALAGISEAIGLPGLHSAARAVRACFPEDADDGDCAMTLAYVVCQCIRVQAGASGQTIDRNSMEAKVVTTPGVFLEKLFRDRWDTHARTVAADLALRRPPPGEDAAQALAHAVYDSEMGQTLDKWLKSAADNSPVFDLPRYTAQGAMAYVSRVIDPVSAAEIDTRAPHSVHPSQYGFLCPIETPEGKQIGLTNSFATFAAVTGGLAQYRGVSGREKIRHEIELAGSKRIHSISDAYSTPVLLDGVCIGFVDRPARLVETLRARRRKGHLHREVSVSWGIGNPVHVRAHPGRLMRPLIIRIALDAVMKKDGTLPSTWHDCLRGDKEQLPLVEYLDVAESFCAFVAPPPDHVRKVGLSNADPNKTRTHHDLHTVATVSNVAAMTPFADHNPAPRNVFSCKQMKACASVPATNFRTRMFTSTHVLHSGQRPIVDTAWAGMHGSRDLPFGVNAMVAIASFTGYNQEDAIVMNAASVQRGMFASTHIHTVVKDENPRDGGLFCDPASRSVDARGASYADLESNGLPRPGARVRPGTAIIGHVTNDNRDTSLVCDLTTHGTVQHALMFDKGGVVGRRAKVCLYDARTPCVGDKFASRHGQKGICAILLPADEMLVMNDGTVPDLVINPHAFPSRMTVGQILEGICAKTACFEGTPFVDSTVSAGISSDEAAGALAPYAEMFGSELAFDPRTGGVLECTVTFTPTFYMRLTQMVIDKIGISRNGRTRRDIRTGQPVRGRAEAGALRIGEMETNVILAHGASMFLRDAFTRGSDSLHVEGAAFSDGRVCVPDAIDGTLPLRDRGWMTERTFVPSQYVPRGFSLFQAEVAGGLGVAMDVLPGEKECETHA